MNPVAMILDALRIPSEPQLPESLIGATPVQLAEVRSRILQIIQTGREINKLIDQELAGALQGSAFRYGDDVYRPSNGKGTAKVRDEHDWWREVVAGLKASPRAEDLLSALYPASSVRLTALAKLAAALGVDTVDLKDAYIVYEPSTSPLSVMPIQKAPAYLRDLEEGEVRSLQ